MKVKLAAVVAEIARTVDYSLLESEPKFTNLSRPHRMSLILACLAREDIARVEKLRKSVVLRWLSSKSLNKYSGIPLGERGARAN
jgi:hypothetical protein